MSQAAGGQPHGGGRRRRLAGIVTGTLLLFGWLASPLALAADRVVSLNLCTDQMLVLLAPEKVVALSTLARDPALSYVARQAAGLPTVRPSAEAVLRLHPDLVLAGDWGAQATLAVLAQEGLPVLRFDSPRDFPAIRAQTRRLAQLLGHPERGAALVAAMDATLAAIPAPIATRTALALEPRLYTAGPGSLMDAVLRAAGLTNQARGERISMETLLRHPPDLLVVPAAARYPSLATAMLGSPALDRIPRRTIPPALTICGGPFTAQAVAQLAQ